ncbi:hypothetical protein GCM10020295_01730 [Streptomyces cinereospinus]
MIISVPAQNDHAGATGSVTDTTLLPELDGVSVARVERPAGGRRRVPLVTADETARARPACGVFATRVTGSAVTRPRDLPYGESGWEFRWHKRRWWCREAGRPHPVLHRATPTRTDRADDSRQTDFLGLCAGSSSTEPVTLSSGTHTGGTVSAGAVSSFAKVVHATDRL